MSQFGPAYPKINSLWKRDFENKSVILPGEFAQPEFEDLRSARWEWSEKIDGTNIRIFKDEDGDVVIGGRTDRANIPAPLYKSLEPIADRIGAFAWNDNSPVTVFGEGYGAGIQQGGGYRSKPGFIVFDIRIGEVYLGRETVENIASGLDLEVVHSYGVMTLDEAWIKMCYREFETTYVDHELEGIVGRPVSRFYVYKNGHIAPLLCKMKYVDITDYEKATGIDLSC